MLKTMGLDALIGPSSVLGYLHTHGAPVSPHAPPATRPNDRDRPEEHKNFNGGHTVGHHGSHRDDGVDAIQIEVGYDFRKDNEARHRFGDILAAAMAKFSNTYQLSQKQPKPAQQS